LPENDNPCVAGDLRIGEFRGDTPGETDFPDAALGGVPVETPAWAATDPRLTTIVQAWPALPEPIRAVMAALVPSASTDPVSRGAYEPS